MKSKIIFLAVMSVFTLALSPIASAQNQTPSFLPKNAVEIAPGVYDLGKAKDPKTGKIVDGLAIVHSRSNDAKGQTSNAKPTPGGGTSCYGFLAKGAKWKQEESWVINAQNTFGLDQSNLLTIMSLGVDKWETAAQKINILGQGTLVADTLAAGDNINGVNEVEFADLNSSGTIAVTTIWGYFGGPVLSRELLEWDMEFNTDFTWATDGSLENMDFENIAVHELGHSFGMADLYTSSCNQETMYGYASEGETNKRDLGNGDIFGIRTLYK